MRKWFLFGAGLTVMCLAAIANAQTPSPDLYSYASYANRVETLERELAQVHAQLASFGTEGDKDGKYSGDSVSGNSSWTVGAEVALLKPFVGLPDIGQDFEYQATPRVWLGYENAAGLGFEVTYWQFDSANNTGLGGAEVHTLDFDVTQRGQFCNWDLMVFGGLRYGKFEADVLGLQVLDFEGIGPTLGVEVRRPIGDRGLALVANTRGAILFDDNTDLLGGGITISDTSMSVWQSQLGVEWSRCVFGSSHLVVRALYEAQRWEGPSVIGVVTPSATFGGPTLSVGIVR